MFGFGKYEKKENDITCSVSRILALREGPEYYDAKYISKTIEDTDSMNLGSLVHCAILEPEKLEDNYHVMPEKTEENSLTVEQIKQTLLHNDIPFKTSWSKPLLIKAARDSIADFPIQYDELVTDIPENKERISFKQMQSAKDIAKKIHAIPNLKKFFDHSQTEVEGYFTDEKTGIVIRFFKDIVSIYKNIGVIFEVKYTKDWNQRNFDRTNYSSGRFIQAACYKKAGKILYGRDFRVVFIAIEPKAPFRVRAYEMNEATLEAGQVEFDFYLDKFHKRTLANYWGPDKEDLMIKETALTEWDWNRIPEVIYE